jgi:hypothetical protein
LADILSTGVTAGVIEAIHSQLASRLQVVAVTAIVDGGISLGAFAALHFLANRHRGAHDVVRVQMHRWVLSPLHYLVGIGLQYALLSAGVRPGIGVLIAYWGSMAFVRLVHTVYGMRSGLFD